MRGMDWCILMKHNYSPQRPQSTTKKKFKRLCAPLCPPSSGVRLIILQRMSLYAFADAPISAGFRNRLRLAMILSGRAAVSKKLL